MNVRPMADEDRSALVWIVRHTPEFGPADIPVAEEVLDAYLKDPVGSGYNVLVAEDASGVVGYICYGPTPVTVGTWDIYWMAVAPMERGRGVGRVLMQCAEAAIRDSFGRLAIIETSSKLEYERTRSFHLSQGYLVVSRVPDFYAPGDDKLILCKRLKEEGRRED